MTKKYGQPILIIDISNFYKIMAKSKKKAINLDRELKKTDWKFLLLFVLLVGIALGMLLSQRI